MKGTKVTAKGMKYNATKWNAPQEFTEYENYLAKVYGIDVTVPEQVEQFREEYKNSPRFVEEFENEYQQWKNGRTK